MTLPHTLEAQNKVPLLGGPPVPNLGQGSAIDGLWAQKQLPAFAHTRPTQRRPFTGARHRPLGPTLGAVPGALGSSPVSGLPPPVALAHTLLPDGRKSPPPRAPSSPHAPRTSARGPAQGAPAKSSPSPRSSPTAPGASPTASSAWARPATLPASAGPAKATHPLAPPSAARHGDSRSPRLPLHPPPPPRTKRPAPTKHQASHAEVRGQRVVQPPPRPATASPPPCRAPAASRPVLGPRGKRGAVRQGRAGRRPQAVAAAYWSRQTSLICIANGKQPGRGYRFGF